jgi:hypothetical protein
VKRDVARLLPISKIVTRNINASRIQRWGSGVLQEAAMYAAYNLRPDRKAGSALAFIVFGSIAAASGVVVQMADHERNGGGKSVIAAVRFSPSATRSTIVSPASPAVSAPHKQQASSLPPNSVQAAPNHAITATTTEVSQPPVAASKKSQKTARSHKRPARGWYDAYAWRRPQADYRRGRRYSYERPDSSW